MPPLRRLVHALERGCFVLCTSCLLDLYSVERVTVEFRDACLAVVVLTPLIKEYNCEFWCYSLPCCADAMTCDNPDEKNTEECVAPDLVVVPMP